MLVHFPFGASDCFPVTLLVIVLLIKQYLWILFYSVKGFLLIPKAFFTSHQIIVKPKFVTISGFWAQLIVIFVIFYKLPSNLLSFGSHRLSRINFADNLWINQLESIKSTLHTLSWCLCCRELVCELTWACLSLFRVQLLGVLLGIMVENIPFDAKLNIWRHFVTAYKPFSTLFQGPTFCWNVCLQWQLYQITWSFLHLIQKRNYALQLMWV